MTNMYNWELIETQDLPDYKSVGLHYKHKKTGLEVFHMLNDDEENLFAFGFKTLSESSNGAAHILEHSVLCGSKNYPLKDPFMQLNSQSVKTFLNAMTFPDKTVYPASSMVEADYFNLMSVYGDAVFFPLLNEHIFNQEAHRYELDENGNVTIQGVVFNEMKGAYSSFDNVVGDHFLQNLLAGTTYQWDSGGDPAIIPTLTHEQLKAYHAKYYSPSNCRIFLFGNIPTEKQLLFIEEKFLSSFSKDDGMVADTNNLPHFESPIEKTLHGPSTEEETGATVLLNWVLGESSDLYSYMEAVLLAEILLGHDGSPLSHALLASKLGEDISPNTGLDGELKYTMFSVGMRGVKEKNAHKLKDCILDCLQNLVDNGIPAQNIEAALMAVDFSHREVKRGHGPWSLILMRRILRGWFNGLTPFEPLKTRDVFETIKNSIEKSPDGSYLKNLIKKFFLENTHELLLTVVPSKKYDKEIEAEFNALNKKCPFSHEELIKNQKILHEFQQSEENEKLREKIPHLKPSEFSSEVDKIKTTKTTIGDIPVFVHNEAVNAIAYVDVGIPVDTIQPEMYQYLPFFSTCFTNMGFNGMDWTQASEFVANITGGFGSSLYASSMPDWTKTQDDVLLGHDWLFVRVKMLAEKTTEGVNLLFDCIKNIEWNDFERLHDLAVEYKNDFQASIVPAGHEYAASRSACLMSHSKTVDEIWNGLSQFATTKRLATMEKGELIAILSSIHKTILESGIVANITVDDASSESAKKALAENLVGFKCPNYPQKINNAEFEVQTVLNEADFEGFLEIEENPAKNLTLYTVNTQVGFASSIMRGSGFGSKEAVYESLFAHWFSNNVMWEKIRTIGGAYGGFSYVDTLEKMFSLTSYRDPNPQNSIDVFKDSLLEHADILLDIETLERVIAGCYSKEIQPRAPSTRGFAGFIRQLFGIRDEDREARVKLLLSATPSDVQSAAKRLASNVSSLKNSAICSKSMVK